MNGTDLKILMILGLLIGAVFPFIPTRRERFFRDYWQYYVGEQKRHFTLPRPVRKYYGFEKRPVDLVTYLHYVSGFYTKICFGLLIIPCIFLDAKTFAIVFSVFASVFLLVDIPQAFLARRAIFKKELKNAKESLLHKRNKERDFFPNHTRSTSVRHLFDKHFDDFERMKEIVLQDKMPSTVFSKKGIVLNYSHLTRCKKHFTSEDYAFSLGFFQTINPYYIDVVDGNVQFDFMIRKGDQSMIVWSSLEMNSKAFRECFGDGSDVERLHAQWYMVKYK